MGLGQEDEKSILHNSEGSERYYQFVDSLGWEIKIGEHAGYLGGLERNEEHGAHATYYCNSQVEVLFHDVTKIPLDPEDPKQLKKVRSLKL